MDSLQLKISDEAIEFVKINIESLEINNPIPVLIYGKFSDEKDKHFRISLQEKDEFDKYYKNNGTFVQAKGIPDIFIDESFEKTVKNKKMVLINDVIEFE